MNARSILRRLAVLHPDLPPIEVLGPEAELVRAGASAAGWKVRDGGPEARVIVWFGPASPVAGSEIEAALARHPDAETICAVGSGARCELPGFATIRARTFRLQLRIDDWMAERAAAAGVPEDLRKRAGALWRAWHFDEVVGNRYAAMPLPGNFEQLLRRSGLAGARADSDSAADRLRAAAMTFFGVGDLPLVGATLASAIVALLAALLVWTGAGALCFNACFGALCLLGIIGCVALEPWSQRHYLATDPREVVLDEVAGMSATLLVAQTTGSLTGVALCFVAFRFFDIFKFGVHWIEAMPWRGALLWDDILAGIYAGLAVLLVVRVAGL